MEGRVLTHFPVFASREYANSGPFSLTFKHFFLICANFFMIFKDFFRLNMAGLNGFFAVFELKSMAVVTIMDIVQMEEQFIISVH